MDGLKQWLVRKGNWPRSGRNCEQNATPRPECKIRLEDDAELQLAEHDKLHPGALCNVFSFQFENPNAPQGKELAVLVPIHPNVERYYVNSCLYLLKRTVGDFRRCRIIFDSAGEVPPRGTAHPHRQSALAKIRQDMIDRYLGAADWVAWMDADIVFYPPHLLRTLVERADGGIAAPMVIMDGISGTVSANSDGFGPGRFYDVAGFVENLRWARFTEPWFDQPGPVYSLDSVGSCYVVNAEIYRSGARHVADPYSTEFVRQGLKWTRGTVRRNQQQPANSFTEHFSVCQWAKEHGFPVRAFGDLVARHARA